MSSPVPAAQPDPKEAALTALEAQTAALLARVESGEVDEPTAAAELARLNGEWQTLLELAYNDLLAELGRTEHLLAALEPANA